MPAKTSKLTNNVGLALGSGSARGWAHVGVIKALAEAGIRVTSVAGTSIGALVGAVYASGNLDAFEQVVLRFDWKQILSFFDVVLPKSGLIDGKKVAELIRRHVADGNIEDLPLAFSAVATDLYTGREISISEGDIIEAVRASISVPGMFTPVCKDGAILVDGGLVNPVPVNVARDLGAEFVIAVDLNHNLVKMNRAKTKKHLAEASSAHKESASPASGAPQSLAKSNTLLGVVSEKVKALDLPKLPNLPRWPARDTRPGVFDVLTTSINIMQTEITVIRLESDPPDLLIQPKLGDIGFLEFHRAREAIAEGYEETLARISPLMEEQRYDHP